jgi:hypothetical protein
LPSGQPAGRAGAHSCTCLLSSAPANSLTLYRSAARAKPRVPSWSQMIRGESSCSLSAPQIAEAGYPLTERSRLADGRRTLSSKALCSSPRGAALVRPPLHHALPGRSFSFLVRTREITVQASESSVQFPHLRLSVRRLFARSSTGTRKNSSRAPLSSTRVSCCVFGRRRSSDGSRSVMRRTSLTAS